jgi:hypothetical protein
LRDRELEEARWFTPQQIVDGLSRRQLPSVNGAVGVVPAACRTGCSMRQDWIWMRWSLTAPTLTSIGSPLMR